jgi:ABC-type phosphate transport system substrate-binding protein
MRGRKGSRRLRMVGGAAAVLALVGLTACDYGQETRSNRTITLVGSDTTQDVMNNIAFRYTLNQPIGGEHPNGYNPNDANHDTLVNISAVQNPARSAAGDVDCGNRTWFTPPASGTHLAPNGSSAGRDALRDDTPGCVDIARSSSGPRAIGPTGDKASFEYYAFGVDGVSWATHPSSPAPTNLTLAQLQGIFNCTFTNWNQVGGTAGQIQRYFPQSGSGTRAFVVSDLLGGQDPVNFQGPNCPAVIPTQENSGELIALNGDQTTAVVPYSAGNWIAQANDVVNPDQRAGQQLFNLNGSDFVVGSGTNNRPGPAVVEENVRLVDPTPGVPGIRFIFNVVDTESPSYVTAKRYVGFENEENGDTAPLCSNKFRDVVTSFGFGALDASPAVPSTNLAGATCRKYVPTA